MKRRRFKFSDYYHNIILDEIAQIYKKLNATPGVVDTLDVQLVRRGGIGYSDVSFNIEDYMSVDGRVLSIPKTHVFEIRSPGADIKGTIT